jgi:hypothetical protein
VRGAGAYICGAAPVAGSVAPVRSPLLCLVPGAAVVFLVASCGSAAPSAADYRQRLDALCASLSKFNRSLPELQASQHLSFTQLQERVRQEDSKFRSDVGGLTPPAQLSSAHQVLTGHLAHGPADGASRATVIGYARQLQSDYTALGAAGCAAGEQQAVASLNALPSVSPSAAS